MCKAMERIAERNKAEGRAEGEARGERKNMLATAKRMLKSGMLALKSCFYIVKFPSMWNNVEFIEDSIFKGMDLEVIEPRILRSGDDLASSVTYWTNFLNFGKGVAIFRLPKDDASSVLYVNYGLPQAMELDVQIPISEFKRSSCLVDQSFQALALCGLQLVPFVREFLLVKLIYDYSKCFL